MFDLIYRFDPSAREADLPATADEAVARLEAGNRDFAELLLPSVAGGAAGAAAQASRVLRFGADGLGMPQPDGSPPVQRPFAAVLACSDARVPIEMVFGQAVNDLFVVRVAGNVLAAECLGSLEYAAASFPSLKVVAVLGHSGCGAVTAAADVFVAPSSYLKYAAVNPLRAIVDRTMTAVRSAHWALEQVYGHQVEARPGYRRALVETAVVLNAALNAATVRDEMAARLGPDRKVVFGVYDLASRQFALPLDPADPAVEGAAVNLVAPPADPAGFDRLGVRVAGSTTIRTMVG